MKKPIILLIILSCIVIPLLVIVSIINLHELLKTQKNQRDLDNIISAVETDFESIRSYAQNILSGYEGEYNINQVCEIHSFLVKNWSYFDDPYDEDYFSTASNTINTGLKGDCDDFAITMAALIHSIGGKVRITTVQDSIAGHMFTEVYLVENPQKILTVINQHYQNFFQFLFGIDEVNEINYIKNDDEKGIWLNLDWSSKYPGGEYFIGNRCIIFYPFEEYFKTECEF